MQRTTVISLAIACSTLLAPWASAAERAVDATVASSQVLFKDSFARWRPEKWTVDNIDTRSPLPAYTVRNNRLEVTVDGGSDGYMGVASGVSFAPNITPLSGDFEVVASVAELMREARDGYRDNSGLGISLGSASLLIRGNFSGYWPGYEYGTYHRHRISAFGRDGEVCGIDESLDLDTLYQVELRMRRWKGVSSMGYRLAGGAWIDWSCQLPEPAVPALLFWSGDGGYTRSTGRFTGSVDKFVIRVPLAE